MPASLPSRRRDIQRTYTNALLWALGNGFISTTLVVYLALSLGAGSVLIAWLCAAPRFAGVLRLATPGLISAAARHGWGRKQVCLAGYGLSGLVLLFIPWVAWGTTDTTVESTRSLRLVLLALAWCVYHLLEYLATVSLWSWIGDFYPRAIRSRLLGLRERWLTTGRLAGIAVSILLAAGWTQFSEDDSARVPLAFSASIGALLMLAALIPLARTNALAAQPSATPVASWQALRRAWSEKPYRRLLQYNCWLSFANGLTGSAQAMYPSRVLGVPYEQLQTYRAVMWGGQGAIAPACGRAIAHVGAKRVMLPAQLLVATGPLLFWLASEGHAYWIAVAHLAWIAYAALNVGLDTLKLNLALPENNAPYLAVFYASSDLINGLTILLGGLLYDTLAAGDAHALNVYAGLFLTGFVCRLLAAPLITRLVEPGRGIIQA